MTWNAIDSRRVPDKGSANNNTINEVVGNKTDSHSDSSLYGKTKMLVDHIHGAQYIYPNLAAAVTLASSDVAWSIGDMAYTEVIPEDTVTKDFDLHFVDMTMDANSLYQVNFYRSDPAEYVFIGSVATTRNTNQVQASAVPIMTPLQEANSRIMAKAASSAAAADEVDIKVFYHEY